MWSQETEWSGTRSFPWVQPWVPNEFQKAGLPHLWECWDNSAGPYQLSPDFSAKPIQNQVSTPHPLCCGPGPTVLALVPPHSFFKGNQGVSWLPQKHPTQSSSQNAFYGWLLFSWSSCYAHKWHSHFHFCSPCFSFSCLFLKTAGSFCIALKTCLSCCWDTWSVLSTCFSSCYLQDIVQLSTSCGQAT